MDNSTRLRVLSFNIRYDNPQDAPNDWPRRQPLVCDLLQREQPDLFGLQEALQHQLSAIAAALPTYGWVGVGRDDGSQAGEFCPIFFSSARFDLLQSGTFWLSDTPDVAGSKSWPGCCRRIATWAQLHDRDSKRHLLFCNTHFEYESRTTRVHSAHLLLERVEQLRAGRPAIVSGDFNCTPGSPPYHILSSADSPLVDSATIAKTHSGPAGTVNHDFSGRAGDTIDYIFTTQPVSAAAHSVLSTNDSGRYPSDHFPLCAELDFTDLP